MPDTLYSLPQTFTAGTTVSYTRTLSDYPATAGWTLTLYLNSLTSATSSIAVASGDDYVVTLTATATGALAAGVYTYSETVTSGSTTYEVGRGTVAILPKLASAVAGTVQTTNEKLLALVETALTGRITADMESYSIGGRTINKIPFRDLLRVRGQLRAAIHFTSNPTNPIGYMGVTFTDGGS